MLKLDRTLAPSLEQYETIFYLDSDAGITPRLQNRSVEEFFEYWQSKHILMDCKEGGKFLLSAIISTGLSLNLYATPVYQVPGIIFCREIRLVGCTLVTHR